MEHYRDCFGGALELEGLPYEVQNQLPGNMRHIVVRAKLTTPHFTLFGSDLGQTTANGRISLLLHNGERESLHHIFSRLSVVENSDADFDEITSVTDRFGIEWLLNFR